ncbi:GMC oxidoreductase [Hypoxylon sp. FL0543]|nr:GMC oxidoreductase [Hypoxylon sp. FL0543]
MDSADYDFVIIGGGTAGLVLANRLSEDPSQRILVLEAGADVSDDPRVKTPALYRALMGTEVDWNFHSEPQPNLNGRSVDLHQGKALGGSSAINAEVFAPPTDGSISSWGALGNEGWDSSIFRKYYVKVFTPPSVEESSRKKLGIDGYPAYEAPNGPVRLTFAGNPDHPVREAWIATFKESDYHVSSDPLRGISVGAFSCISSIDPVKKERSYAATAYYNPVKHRVNLEVLTNATAEKVLFEVTDFIRATGVQYRHNNRTETVTASKEVIVCAGTFQSPKILELSGIGNKSILHSHEIKVIKDLPGVGENLQDHLVSGASFETVDGVETLDPLVREEPEAIEKAMRDYATSRSGPLSSTGIDAYAYLPLVDYLSEEGQETIRQLLSKYRPSGDHPHDRRARLFHELAERAFLKPDTPSATYLAVLAQQVLPTDPDSDSPPGPLPGGFITLGALLSQPLSRGSVHIASNDPSAAPAIDPNYLSNPVDIEILARHMLYLETIATSPPFSKLLKQPLVRRDPASCITDIESAKKYIRTTAISMWHFGGTCAMLPEDKGGVVSSTLKVHGVENLRVVDSSAVPILSTANMQSTVYTLAERAADLIKQDHGLR